MSEKEQKTITVELDGKTRELGYDWAACEAAEAVIGKSLFEMVSKGQPFSLTDVKVLLWAGLQHEKDPMTLDAVTAALKVSRYSDYLSAVAKALGVIFAQK